jgi:hypothetical protein
MTVDKLIEDIQENIEWLETTQGDEVECISIENLEGILTRMLGTRVLISESECLPKPLNKTTDGNNIE